MAASGIESRLPRYDQCGSGPDVVCSHGMLMDRSMFAPQLEGLCDAWRVTAFDHRARSDRWEGPYSLYDLTDDCVALLDHLGIARCMLVGMSMGGFMAIRFALAHPERLTGLVLIGSSALAYTPLEQEHWLARYARLEGSPRVPRELAEDEVPVCFGPTFRREHPDQVERWVERWLAYPGDAVYQETASWIRQDDVIDRLGEISVPVLAIHGADDIAVPLEGVERTVEALREANLVVVPGAGHTPNLEQPGVVNGLLRGFLSRTAGR